MRHSLHSHILYLEDTIQQLKDRLTLLRLSADERAGLELQLAMAERALARYREAYALEISVAGSEPPAAPGAKSGGGTGEADTRSSKKKHGQSAIQARTSRQPARRSSAISATLPGLARSRAFTNRTHAA